MYIGTSSIRNCNSIEFRYTYIILYLHVYNRISYLIMSVATCSIYSRIYNIYADEKNIGYRMMR